MAKPAAPGAHLRTPRSEWTAEAGGGGGRAQARRGAQSRHGGGHGCVPSPGSRTGVSDPRNPGTPRSRPREVLAG